MLNYTNTTGTSSEIAPVVLDVSPSNITPPPEEANDAFLVGDPALVAFDRHLALLDESDGYRCDPAELDAAFDAVSWHTPLFETGDAIWLFIVAALLFVAPAVREDKISSLRAMNRLAIIASSRGNLRILRRGDFDRLLHQLVNGEIPDVLPQRFVPEQIRSDGCWEDGNA